jgi:hypothetical protein
MDSLRHCQTIVQACEAKLKETDLPLAERVCLEAASREAWNTFRHLCEKYACAFDENHENGNMFASHAQRRDWEKVDSEQMDAMIAEMERLHAGREAQMTQEMEQLKAENRRLAEENERMRKQEADVLEAMRKDMDRPLPSAAFTFNPIKHPPKRR